MVCVSRMALPEGNASYVTLGSEDRKEMESSLEMALPPTHCSPRNQIRKEKLMRGISLTLSYLEISTLGYKEHTSVMSHD